MIYSATGNQAVTASKSPLILGSTAAIRPRILAYDVSTDGTPTSDQGVKWQIQRATALGTSTAYTPTPTDPSDPASVFTAGSNCTIEPTYTAAQILYERATNPRATWQWAAYDQRSEIIMPATASNGVGWQVEAVGGAAGSIWVNVTVLE